MQFDLDLLGGRRGLDALVDEVLACGELGQKRFREGAAERAILKPDRSPVTEADGELERRLRAFVAARHPTAAFVGEETGMSGPEDAALRFVVDPIDGTRAFMRGVPTWSVLVGVEHHGSPVVGIAFLPAMERLFVAARGHGAHADGRPIHLSRVARLDEATVCHAMLGHFVEAGAGPLLERLATGSYTQRGVHDFDGFAQVLLGTAEAMVDPGASAWDLCAAAVLLREAGGRLTSLTGEETIRGGGGLASNGLVHEALVSLLDPAKPPA
jgi:histidinol-phosphatase